MPGQHVDVRLTAEDGYQAQRSYSIASPPEEDGVALTVERLPDGEVSMFLSDELRVGDQLELRGPLGGYFTWTVEQGGPLALVAGGSGIAALMAMVRHGAARRSSIRTHLLCSWRTEEDVIYRDELARLAARNDGLEVRHTLTRGAPAVWRGETRRIDRRMLVEALPGADARPLAYVWRPAARPARASRTRSRSGNRGEGGPAVFERGQIHRGMVVRSADGKNLAGEGGLGESFTQRSSEVATRARADEDEPEVRREVRGDDNEEHAAYRLGGPLAYGDEGGGGLL